MLLIAKNHLTHKYKNFVGQSLTDKKQKIEESLKGDQGLKKLLLGTIIGHFTEDELEFYFQHEAAINKRLLVFIYKRITDQMNYFS